MDIDPHRAAATRIGTFALRTESSLLDTVFQEWAMLDLDAAVASGIRLSHAFTKVALRAILKARSDLPEQTRQEIELRMGDEGVMQTSVR